jgi:predicted nucleotidyltransferase
MPHSDIDIYVEDLEAKRYWDLWRELEELANQPVDLYCQLDDPVFVEKIKKRGELIYEG